MIVIEVKCPPLCLCVSLVRWMDLCMFLIHCHGPKIVSFSPTSQVENWRYRVVENLDSSFFVNLPNHFMSNDPERGSQRLSHQDPLWTPKWRDRVRSHYDYYDLVCKLLVTDTIRWRPLLRTILKEEGVCEEVRSMFRVTLYSIWLIRVF